MGGLLLLRPQQPAAAYAIWNRPFASRRRTHATTERFTSVSASASQAPRGWDLLCEPVSNPA